MSDQQLIEVSYKDDHPKRRAMICKLIELSNCDTDGIDFDIWNHLKYSHIIRPLVLRDRKNEVSYMMLQHRYGVTKSTIINILKTSKKVL